jgi:hypothetical protein
MQNFTVAFQTGSYTFRLHEVAISNCICQKYKKKIAYRQFIYSYTWLLDELSA